MVIKGSFLPVANPPPSPSLRQSGTLRVATLCAVSAAFAACMTSLLCVLILNNREGHNIFGNNQEPSQSDLMKALQLQHLDLMKALQLQREQKDGMAHLTTKTTVTDTPPSSVVNKEKEVVKRASELDFAIMGWPKTGTSFLLNILGEHPEITMPKQEFCDIVGGRGHEKLSEWMENEVALRASQPSGVPPQKYGIKCPQMIRRTESIENLMKLSDSTRLVIGMRHPVLWFESFYNYRVKENYDRNLSPGLIKIPDEVIGQQHWKDCSTSFAQYDLYLKQLAKVPLTTTELINLSESSVNETMPKTLSAYWAKRVSPNPYKVFIYTPEQLGDKNATRQEQFRKDLQDFLRLEAPLANFDDAPKVNSNHVTYPEYIDICDPKFTHIKNTLLEAGKRSKDWILSKFVKSNDVIVSDMEFFTENVRTWSDDPCRSRNVGFTKVYGGPSAVNEGSTLQQRQVVFV